MDNNPLSDGKPELLEISSGRDYLIVEKLGAKIVGLSLAGVQILNTPDGLRFDHKQAVTHPCSPNFGAFGMDLGFPKHGSIRNTLLNEVDHASEPRAGRFVLSAPIMADGYPSGVTFSQEFSLHEGVCRIVTTHKNEGAVSAPVVSGEHFYWAAGQTGWDKAAINEKSIADLVKSEGVADIALENRIVIPGHAAILLKQSGYTRAVYWSMPHMDGRNFDKHYFCFEPVEFDPSDFGKAETLIQPGHTRTSVIQLSLMQDLGKN